jgi:NADPH2:quinone reductase
MTTTTAVRCRAFGDASVLELAQVPTRSVGPGELAVDVVACGLNRADLLQREGRYPAPAGYPPDILGLEYCGRVAAVGEGVTDWRAGDRVMGIVGGGAMVRRLNVHAREALRVPDRLSDVEAAAVPEVFLTTFDALMLQAQLGVGETVLIHAAASGIGTAASQLVRVAGGLSIGTSRSAEKLSRAKAFGLDDGLVVAGPNFADEVLQLTGGRGADVVLDTVGGPYFTENVKALAPRGRMVLVGTLGGGRAEVPLGLWMSKRATVHGTVLRSRPLEEKASLARQFARQLLPLFASGRLLPVVDQVLPMSEIAEAHRRLEADANVGKVVLRWD